MKLRLYFRPGPVVLLLAGAALLSWWLACRISLWLLPIALFYSLLSATAGYAWLRIQRLERWMTWPRAGRLLIFAPHEDDCAISVGGLGALNHRLGGATRIVYLAPDEAPGMAEIRADEARAAWREAGVADDALHHRNLLPPLMKRDPQRLREAARALRQIIDEFKPTTIVVPMFEGGHVHHDMVAALLREIMTENDVFDVFEAPEYGPYVSCRDTPHRVIALCGRWLLGLVSYYGPADGVDGRPIEKVVLTAADLACKKRMLAAFESQNAPSLVATRSYPDRLVRWNREGPRRPFDPDAPYNALVNWAEKFVPPAVVGRLLPGQRSTIGRPGQITDWTEEWGA